MIISLAFHVLRKIALTLISIFAYSIFQHLFEKDLVAPVQEQGLAKMYKDAYRLKEMQGTRRAQRSKRGKMSECNVISHFAYMDSRHPALNANGEFAYHWIIKDWQVK